MDANRLPVQLGLVCLAPAKLSPGAEVSITKRSQGRLRFSCAANLFSESRMPRQGSEANKNSTEREDLWKRVPISVTAGDDSEKAGLVPQDLLLSVLLENPRWHQPC